MAQPFEIENFIIADISYACKENQSTYQYNFLSYIFCRDPPAVTINKRNLNFTCHHSSRIYYVLLLLTYVYAGLVSTLFLYIFCRHNYKRGGEKNGTRRKMGSFESK